MGITNGNTEPDKRSYTPFSEADRIQMLGTTSEGIDKGPVLFDENKVSPEELRQIVGKDIDLIPASEKLSKLSPLPDVSKMSRFDNLDKMSFPELMGLEEGIEFPELMPEGPEGIEKEIGDPNVIKDPKPTSAPDIYIDPKPKASSITYYNDNIPKPVDESQIDDGSQNYADRDFDG